MQRIRYDLLCEWMWWLVEGFVIPLLRVSTGGSDCNSADRILTIMRNQDVLLHHRVFVEQEPASFLQAGSVAIAPEPQLGQIAAHTSSGRTCWSFQE
jgi:hypothetical protein